MINACLQISAREVVRLCVARVPLACVIAAMIVCVCVRACFCEWPRNCGKVPYIDQPLGYEPFRAAGTISNDVRAVGVDVLKPGPSVGIARGRCRGDSRQRSRWALGCRERERVRADGFIRASFDATRPIQNAFRLGPHPRVVMSFRSLCVLILRRLGQRTFRVTSL
jgi:hypothetical protein